MTMGKGSAEGKEKYIHVPGDFPAWTSGKHVCGSFAGKPWDLEKWVSICQTDTHKSRISLSNTSWDWFCFPSGISIIGKRLKGLWMKPSSGGVTLLKCAGDARLHIPHLRSGSLLCLYSLYPEQQNLAGPNMAFLAFLLQSSAKSSSPEKKNPFN